MMEAVRAWEEAYLLEPTNLRAREFLRSALERIHAHMGPKGGNGQPQAPTHPWLPAQPPAVPLPTPPGTPAVQADPSGETQMFASPPLASEAATWTFPTPKLPVAPPPARAAQQPPPAKAPEPRPPSSPWDDGPSVAIPQAEDPGDKSNDAWSLSSAPLPMAAVADEETDVWMRGAREMFGLNDFSGALELLTKILDRKPGDKEAQQMHESCEHNLTLMHESKIGDMAGRPRIAIPPDEIIWLNLD